MKKLELDSPVSDEETASIASCIHKIEELWFDAGNVTANGWNILSAAINNRPASVS